MPGPRTPAQPFVGKSTMDMLMRGMDWSRTSIGTPDRWPGTWRAAVRLCLDSSFPMVALLGDEFLFLYNDACMPLVGGKHPQILGQPTAAAWPEIWENPVEPMVRHVLTTGEPAGSDDLFLPLQRHGYAEETHFILAFSLIRDDERDSNAVLVTVRETTERVLVARQLECLDALSNRSFPAETAQEACSIAADVLNGYGRDAPFALLYLLDDQKACLAAHAGVTQWPAGIAPKEISLDSDAASMWGIAHAARSRNAGATEGIRKVLAPHIRDALFVPNVAWTMPLADPQGGTAAVLVIGTNPMRPAIEGRKFAAAVAERLTTALGNARVKQQSRERTEALAALDRAKTLFLSDVSHEFRTPLTLLISPLDDVISHRGLATGDRALLLTARRAATRLLKLVQSLLDFSRVEAGRMEVAFEPTDLATLTSDLVSLFRSTFERGKLALVVECAPLPEAVYVDREMWEKVVLNLVSNAFKFTLDGEVRVTLRAQRDEVVLEVEDTGCGISPDDVPRVFERFHRGTVTRARSAEGSGIGLSLVQELVRLHGGAVELQSVPNKGTRVTVRLRRGSQHLASEQIRASRRQNVATGAQPFLEEISGWVAGPDEQVVRHAPARGAKRAASSAAPLRERVLVVDDNTDMRRYLRRILLEHWTVETATDGMQALARARKSPPDLIIADVMMPGLDGLSLLGALRDDPKTAHVPVMVLSARSNEEAPIDALHAGADDYLPKPFSSRELIARVAVLLARARLRHAEQVAREAAELKSVMKDELMGALSHALRAPLNVMLDTITMLKDASFGSEQARRAFELIQASTAEQHRLIDEVRDLSCLDAGCFAVTRTRIASLSPLVAAEVEAAVPIAAAKRVRLESFIDSAAGPVEADAERIRQAMRTLVGHALACTPAGGNVIVECRGRGTYVEIIVRDNGIGISAETLAHLFDREWQVRRARAEPARRGGIEIGLAVMHRIIEMHGGRIVVRSDGVDRGAMFAIQLPITAATILPQSRPEPRTFGREQ